MSDKVAKSAPRPQLRRFVQNSIKKNLVLSTVSCVIVGAYMHFVYNEGRKQRYANFYKDYDINADFERMRKLGLFDSCSSDE